MADQTKQPERGEHDATYLRKLAEKADGMRGDKHELIIRAEDGMLDVRRSGELEPRGDPIATVKTARKYPDPKPNWSLSAASGPGGRSGGSQAAEDGVSIGDIREKADAMFWDESSLDKFVRRYYDTVDPAQTAQVFEWWSDPDVIAILHPPKSETFRLKADELQTLVLTSKGPTIMTAAQFDDYRRNR